LERHGDGIEIEDVRDASQRPAVEDPFRAFKEALIERAQGAEMSQHMGYLAGAEKPETARSSPQA